MPWSVRAAAAALTLALAVVLALLAFLASQRQAAWGQGLVAVGAVALLLAGLLRRWRIAWLWGRFLGFFLAVLLSLSAYQAWRGGAGPLLLAIPLLGLAAPLLVMSAALGHPSAPAWFGLTCPACGAAGAAPVDLRFRQARCRRCRAVW
jgi:peptidoglycan/LPS O-acetylase OafA/YrhL